MTKSRRWRRGGWVAALVLALVALGGLSGRVAWAQGSPLHPTFALLDATGEPVITTGAPVSTMQTCGQCHDTDYIASHGFHANVGLNDMTAPGAAPNSLPWETGPGLFGGWDALTYRTLTPVGGERLDLTTPDWIRTLGLRHVGGGPAVTSRDGTPLLDLPADAQNPETATIDPVTGAVTAWDWQASGVVEMNCFLCHMPQPDLTARAATLQAGEFGWANTATLGNTGIVTQTAAGWEWSPAAFQADGTLVTDFVTIQDPKPENCGACHDVVYTEDTPLSPATIAGHGWETMRNGQIFSGQRLKDSGLNLAGKEDLARSFDVHAERNVQCVDCHFSLNNPVYYQPSSAANPEHLEFDPRRLDLGEYLQRPDHNFARGQAAQSMVAPEDEPSLRRCDSCHNALETHDWLPYTTLHLSAMSCESCHIPQLYAPAVAENDWTVISPDGQAQVTYRGVDGPVDAVGTLLTGYEPVLLSRQNMDGNSQLMPFNLISSFYWVYGDPAQPVRIEDLRQVYLDGDAYRPEIVAALDTDGDGALAPTELRLATDTQVALIADRLAALGLANPRIEGLVQPFSINHDVTYGDYATKECKTCHSEDSRISRGFLVSAYLPGGVQPTLASDTNVEFAGELFTDDDGALRFRPATVSAGLYMPGHNRFGWVGTVGLLALLVTITGVTWHGGMRLREYGRPSFLHRDPAVRRVYMYPFYERAWHWLQALVIVLLMVTGIIIHRPDMLGGLDLGLVVPVHNVLAALLVMNALFSIFYYYTNGAVRQYLPEPHGYFQQAMRQFDYYMRGVFRGEPHPIQKTPEHRMNPLQQTTYLVILNILLPLQIFTGILMWGAQRWPDLTNRLGGLTWLAPFHTMTAWLFAAFIVLHVYLITTGHTPWENLKAMIIGWETIEVEPVADKSTGASHTASNTANLTKQEGMES